MGTHGNKGRERLTKRERQALKDEGGVIDRGNTAAAGTRLAFRKSSCGVNTGPRRRKFDTRRPAKYRLESDLARCIEYGSTCPTREEARTAFANNERAVLSVPKSRRHIMNISDLSSIHAGPLAEFLGKEWRWGNPDKPIPHKAVYYASRACLGGNHPRHWVPRVH